MSGFQLDKYYLDCVADDGASCIGYAARLSWGPLAVNYSALLECSEVGVRAEQHDYGRSVVTEAGGAIRWSCGSLAVTGEWAPEAAPYECTLLDCAAGRIDWQVLAPRAKAEVRRGGGRVIRGSGYVERLRLAIEPWRLPFHTLHWGRFHGGADTVVWVAWDGIERRRYVLHNGAVLHDAVFNESDAQFGDIRLRFHETRVIHDAPIVSAVTRLPRLLQRIPPAFARAKEVKWVSRAQLSVPGRSPVSGWALHEIVRFA